MHELKHAEAGDAAEDLHPPGPPHPPPSGHDARMPGAERAHGADGASPRRRRSWAGEGPMPAAERKRFAARELRRAYERIKADFSEAYEQCRNDAQRRALERAHRTAKEAYLRALDERLIEDREVWTLIASSFRPERARAERHFSRLVTADALMRILKRLALIETLLGALSV
jgi:hypothetical protein